MSPPANRGTIALERHLAIGGDWRRATSGLYLPPDQQDGQRPAIARVAIDLFCGAGGFSLGLHESGWHVAAAVEFDAYAAMTYLCNLGSPDTELHFLDSDAEARWEKALANEAKRKRREKLKPYAPGAGWIAGQPDQKPVEHFYFGDIRHLDPLRVLADVRLAVGGAGSVVGGPPCQGFSHAGSREVMDPRNSLVFEFMHFVVAVRPKTFVMENVPGMLSMVTAEGVPVIDMLARIAEDGNFMTADAFRRTMAAQAESIGFLRSDTKPQKRSRNSDSAPAAPDSEQLNLLAA